MLLYSLLHLTGYDLPIEQLKQFRQLHSRTPGHPERGCTPGAETTTGAVSASLRATEAPRALKGATRRRIGRARSDVSPVSVETNGRPANAPAISRNVVPELPQSNFALGVVQPVTPGDLTTSPENSTPRPRSRSSVEETSAPGPRPDTQLSPSAIAARISARCDSDLSPGTVASERKAPRGGLMLSSVTGFTLRPDPHLPIRRRSPHRASALPRV